MLAILYRSQTPNQPPGHCLSPANHPTHETVTFPVPDAIPAQPTTHLKMDVSLPGKHLPSTSTFPGWSTTRNTLCLYIAYSWSQHVTIVSKWWLPATNTPCPATQHSRHLGITPSYWTIFPPNWLSSIPPCAFFQSKCGSLCLLW